MEQASKDQFGLKVKLPGGNVANRVLPVRIHDLDNTDIKECELVLGSFLRGVEFIYKSTGVNRPLRAKEDNPHDNLNHTIYRDQINKVALAVRDIIESMKTPVSPGQVTDRDTLADIEERRWKGKVPEVKKHNFPISTTSFIGREKEMKEVRELFDNNRLITIIGTGGCGKTRLACEIASSLLAEYEDGVWFADLAPVSDPNAVVNKVAGVLNIKEVSNQPIIDTFIEKIQNKSLLVLLDNCEHLLQPCAEIANSLLRSVQGIRLLATSREALNVPGEVVFRIPSLSFPDSESNKELGKVSKYEAIKLFIDRAGSSKPGFTLNTQNVSAVAQICRRVEGIPLAIELAATRIRHLGLETILERLEDQFKILSSSSRVAPDRQQTLKAAIDWSYNLLSEQEQLLFNRLSVFAGDFSLEAVEEVCPDEKLKKEDILSLLSQLVDKSLTIADQQKDESMRYKCLEPLRLYSRQKLVEYGEEDLVSKNHLAYYLRMAEKAYDEQYEAFNHWLVKLEKEHNNLLSALDWADHHSPDKYMELSGALSWFWRYQGHSVTGKLYLVKSLTKKKDRTRALARIKHYLALLTMINEGMIKDYEVYDLLNDSFEIFRELGDLREQSIVLQDIGSYEYLAQNNESGLKHCEESLQFAMGTGNRGLIINSTSYVCMGLIILNHIDRAKIMAEKLLKSSEELNHLYGIACGTHFLGDCALSNGHFKEAEKTYAKGITKCLEAGELFVAVNDLHGVAMSVAGQARYAKTIRLNAAALEQYRQLGISALEISFWKALKEKYISAARQKLPEELVNKYEEEGRNMGFEAAVEYAQDFDKD